VENSFSEVSSGRFVGKSAFKTLPEREIARRLRSLAVTYHLTDATVGSGAISLRNRTEKPPWVRVTAFKVAEGGYIIRAVRDWGGDESVWDAAAKDG
jgi:hypothetical protein